MNKNALIIGGTSGLGLKIALILSNDHQVFVTGRKDPENGQLQFRSLELSGDVLGEKMDRLLAELPEIDILVYAAGFFQEGTISDLSDSDILKMSQVGLVAPAMLLAKLLRKQNKLSGFIAITSTSQWIPRLLEPMYTGVKAGLGMLANSLSLDENIGKVLVVGPAGMSTRFWDKDGRDTSDMLDPKWVATKTLKLWEKDFEYKYARALREPHRIEIIEIR